MRSKRLSKQLHRHAGALANLGLDDAGSLVEFLENAGEQAAVELRAGAVGEAQANLPRNQLTHGSTTLLHATHTDANDVGELMNRALLNLELLHTLVRPATPSSSLAEQLRVQVFLRYQSSGAASSRRVASGSAVSRYPDRFGHVHAFVGKVIKPYSTALTN
jgi:hypothetical protein